MYDVSPLVPLVVVEELQSCYVAYDFTARRFQMGALSLLLSETRNIYRARLAAGDDLPPSLNVVTLHIDKTLLRSDSWQLVESSLVLAIRVALHMPVSEELKQNDAHDSAA